MVYLILILHLFTVILDICSTPFPVFVHVFDSGSWLILASYGYLRFISIYLLSTILWCLYIIYFIIGGRFCVYLILFRLKVSLIPIYGVFDVEVYIFRVYLSLTQNLLTVIFDICLSLFPSHVRGLPPPLPQPVEEGGQTVRFAISF